MNNTAWRSDWKQFVSEVAELFDSGHSNEDVTSRYCNIPVEWFGTIARIIIDDDPSVQLAMPEVHKTLSSEKTLLVDYLKLVVNPERISDWKYASVGDTVKFRTHIRSANGPFPGLQWSVYEGEASILINTENSALIS